MTRPPPRSTPSPSPTPCRSTGTACTADGNPCTPDHCNGTNVTCQHPAGNAGAVCRAVAGECDLAESCTGTSTTCPADVVKPNGTACTDDGNVCTPDTCNGSSALCQHPAGNAGTVCRAVVGPCDVAEACTGRSTACPTDAFLPPTTVCRAESSPCNPGELCTGTSAACPADVNYGAVCWLQDLGANGTETVGTTLSITPISGGVAVGHGVIVSVAMDPDSGAVSCSDSKGNIYSLDADQTNGSGTTGVRTLIFSTHVTSALGNGDSIIVTFQNAIAARAVSAAEFYGIVALDQTAGAIGNGITPNSGLTAPTTSANELLYGAIGVETKFNQTFTSGTGYTHLVREQSDPNAGSPGHHVTIDPEFRTVTATGSYFADGTLGGQRLWAAAIATYTAGCGNGIVEGGEQCDDGANNGTTGDCCNTDCTFVAAGTQCRAAAGVCDVAETCTGSSTPCPADGLAASRPVCRAAVNECDLAETCTGTSVSCPADAVQPAGTACTDDGDVCTADVCHRTAGAPACTHPARHALALRRAPAGPRDAAPDRHRS